MDSRRQRSSVILLLVAIAIGCLGCGGTVAAHRSSAAVTQLARKLVLGSILQDTCPLDSGVISPLSIAASVMTFLATTGSSIDDAEGRQQLLRLMGQPNTAAAYDSLLADFGKVRDEVQRTTKGPRPVRLPGCYDDDDDDGVYGASSGDGDDNADDDESTTAALAAAANNGTAPIVHVTDAVFVNRNIMPPPLAADNVRRRIYPADFAEPEQARATINGWVSNSTRGLIGEIIPRGQLSIRTQLAVVNALYFRAHWLTPFDNRSELEFVTDRGGAVERISAPAMYANGCFPYAASSDLDAQIVALPYAAAASGEPGSHLGGGITAYIVKPRQAERARLNQLMYRLNGGAMAELIDSLRMTTVTLTMPRLQLENQFSLRSVLELLGVRSLFRAGINLRSFASSPSPSTPPPEEATDDDVDAAESSSSEANQPQPQPSSSPAPVPSPSPPLPLAADLVGVDNVLHKVRLTVDRTGTEGAAATSSLLDRSLSQVRLTIDGPFLIFIRHDRTGMLLFYGPVYRPDSLSSSAATAA